MPKSILGYTNVMCGGSAIILKNFKLLDDSMNFGITRNSILYEPLNEVLEKLNPSGIIQHLIEFHSWIIDHKFELVAEKHPRILTFDDLSFGFVLWLAACGISAIGFIIELLEYKIRMMIENIIGVGTLMCKMPWRRFL